MPNERETSTANGVGRLPTIPSVPADWTSMLSTPRSASAFLRMPSAMGERHEFPEHTMVTLNGRSGIRFFPFAFGASTRPRRLQQLSTFYRRISNSGRTFLQSSPEIAPARRSTGTLPVRSMTDDTAPGTYLSGLHHITLPFVAPSSHVAISTPCGSTPAGLADVANRYRLAFFISAQMIGSAVSRTPTERPSPPTRK
jgi:hypothetical protein